MILEALHRIVNHRESLSRDEACLVMGEILSGKCTDSQISALLVGLHMKGETVEEIVGFAEAIRAAATPIPVHRNSLSTPAALAVRPWLTLAEREAMPQAHLIFPRLLLLWSRALEFVSPNMAIAVSTPKLDDQGMSAKCGAADVMEALGVNIQLSPALLAECIEQVGIAFLFAPGIHSAAKYVQTARRETRLRTVFNLLGPLTNPMGASAQVVGVYSLDLVEKLAEALGMLEFTVRSWCTDSMGSTKSPSLDQLVWRRCAKDRYARTK